MTRNTAASLDTEPPARHGEEFPADTEPPSSASSALFAVSPADSLSGPDDPMARFRVPASHADIHQRRRKTPLRLNTGTREFYRRLYPGSAAADWNDWRWQMRHRITTPERLAQAIALSQDELSAMSGQGGFPLAVTPYYASLVSPDDPAQAIRRCVVPTSAERVLSPGEDADPLAEDHDSPVPGLVHRYPDRALFLVTDFCSTYCRYCTRSRLVGCSRSPLPSPERWEAALDYIAATPRIRDILISGGDPLTMPDEAIEYLLHRLTRIPHVEFLRIGTKVPVVLPMRVTRDLTRMLRRYHPLWLSLHFTHPDELTHEAVTACERLADAGIPLGSQTVLLKGVNDDPAVMTALYHGLLKARVKPYYLYQCDPIPGSAHFRTTVDSGLDIIAALRGHTTGYAVPHYVIDAPGGGGKIPLLPAYARGYDASGLALRNYKGEMYHYPDFQGNSRCAG